MQNYCNIVKNKLNMLIRKMEKNVSFTESGMESIRLANESAILIAASNVELEKQIHAIEKIAETIKESSDEVADSMKQINDNTQKNCSAVEQVTASSQENAAGTQSLAEIVDKISVLSNQLNEVVNG